MKIPTTRDELSRLFYYELAKGRPNEVPKQFGDLLENWMHTQFINTLAEVRYAFRVCESPIEVIALLELMKWVPIVGPTDKPNVIAQYHIGKHRVDFLVEYSVYKFVVECDGHDFHERTKEQVSRDKKRDREIVSKGYTVFRFSGSEIWRSPQIVTDYLDAALSEEYGAYIHDKYQRG